MGESFGTTIASPLPPIVAPETTSILLLAAAANSGGVLPTPPRSMAPAFSASSSGGPEVNDFHSILYGVVVELAGGLEQRLRAALLVADGQGHLGQVDAAVLADGLLVAGGGAAAAGQEQGACHHAGECHEADAARPEAPSAGAHALPAFCACFWACSCT